MPTGLLDAFTMINRFRCVVFQRGWIVLLPDRLLFHIQFTPHVCLILIWLEISNLSLLHGHPNRAKPRTCHVILCIWKGISVSKYRVWKPLSSSVSIRLPRDLSRQLMFKETCSYQNYSTSLPSFCLDFPQTLPWEYGDVNCWISLDKPWNNANHRKPDRRQSTIALWHGYNLRTSRIRMISERHPICAEVHIMRLEIVNITDNDTNCRWSVWKRLGRTRRS